MSCVRRRVARSGRVKWLCRRVILWYSAYGFWGRRVRRARPVGKGRQGMGEPEPPVWRRIGAWVYEIHAFDTPAACFGPHESLVALWRDCCPDAETPPSRRAFSFEDFRGWWGWITLIDLLDAEGGAVRYRLWGSELASLTKLEMTGKTMQDHHGVRADGTNYNDVDLAFIRELTARCAIGRSNGPVDWDMPGYKSMTTVRLPLSADGVHVTGFLSGVVAR